MALEMVSSIHSMTALIRASFLVSGCKSSHNSRLNTGATPGMPAGHAGIGTTPHLSLELFRRMAGVEVTMVPFKGGGQAQQGIVGAQVPFVFSTTIGILPFVR